MTGNSGTQIIGWMYCRPIILALGLFACEHAISEPQAFVGARLLTIEGPPINEGTLVVANGKISAIGPQGAIEIPPNARLIDVRDKVIMPGLVDTHSHAGEVSGADAESPIQPEVRALDSINIYDPGLRRALAGGITTINLLPGSSYLMSGQTVYIKLRNAETVESLSYRNDDGSIAGGMKMANGTNSRGDKPFPGTRAKSAALVRQAFVSARDYDPSKGRDLGMEALVEVLEGRRVVHHHANRHDDVVTVLRLQREFGFRVVLHHVADAHLIADEIAGSDVTASLIILDSPGGKLEAIDFRFQNAAALERAGVEVAFHTDDNVTDARLLLRMAALAVRGGMSREAALKALTIVPAAMLDLEHRIGSLQEGKDADLVVLSGDPLSVYTRVEQTWVEGIRRFDLTNPDDRLVAEGGYGALFPKPLQSKKY